MAKPMFADNGSGMRAPVDLGRRRAAVRRRQYAGLSQMCSGTSAGSSSTPRRSTPSRTRPPTPTAPGARLRSPVKLAYRPATARPRSASHTDSPKGKRLEARFPDPGQPLSDLHGAVDGRPRRHHQPDRSGGPSTRTSTTRPAREEDPRSLRLAEGLDNLDKDRGFLKAGGVMSDDFIDSYIELKMEEVMRWRSTAPGRIRHVLQVLVSES